MPGALVVERNVLEWRFDPRSDARLAEASYDLHVIVLCSEGYTSSLAAHALQQLGIRRATDVVGGFQAWARAGLPTTGVPGAPVRLAAVPEQADRSGGAPALHVDRDRRTVHVRGEEVELTRREFDLLAHLVDQPQRVLTRRHLLDAVWQAAPSRSGRHPHGGRPRAPAAGQARAVVRRRPGHGARRRLPLGPDGLTRLT